MSCDLGKWPATRTIILVKIALNGSLTAESNARSTWRFNARGPPRFRDLDAACIRPSRAGPLLSDILPSNGYGRFPGKSHHGIGKSGK